MDQFIIKNSSNTMGLDSLTVYNKSKQIQVNNKNINEKLNNFNLFINDKLNNFNPTDKSTNNINYMLKLMWFEYLTHNLTIKKEHELYNCLDLK